MKKQGSGKVLARLRIYNKVQEGGKCGDNYSDRNSEMEKE